jgi:exodeoxyribonuclease-5
VAIRFEGSATNRGVGQEAPDHLGAFDRQAAPSRLSQQLASATPVQKPAEHSNILHAEASFDERNRRRDAAGLPLLPELEGEQADALAAIENFLAGNKPCFVLHGLAGTGKSTLIATLARTHSRSTLVAPTGKAASVLARKTGLEALTLHRLLYRPKVDEEGNLVGFVEKYQPGELAGRVVLVDEASMCGAALAGDLLRTGARVVASGDPGQLPPVEQEPFFTKADVTLREIRRQAAGSSIIRQAHEVRAGRCYVSEDQNFQVIDACEAMRRLEWASVVLCWRNNTRHALNRLIRWRRRRLPPAAPPTPGEPVMCLENHQSGIMNGEIFTVGDYDPVRGLLLEDGPGWLDSPWFEWLSPTGKQPRRRAAFALGYAITTHKSQGSEWPNVLVLDEFTGADRARWLYTSITRASAAICITASLPPLVLSGELAEAEGELLDELAERDAIQNEPALPAPGTPERERLEAAQRVMLAGLHDAALQRPSSWQGANAIPCAGCWCSWCRGRRWWRPRAAPKGWHCVTCHPPPAATARVELQT